jgi:hypothetical protein
MKMESNIYKSLTIDIPTLNNFLFEKYVEPSIINDHEIKWYDKNGALHSFNGFPSSIEKRLSGRQYYLCWHKHGNQIKTHIISVKTESEIISEKIAARNFEGRARKK